MAIKPKLSEESFLQNLFSPAKHAIPSGLRKRPVVQGRGRKAGRVAAYNRMAPVKQELLFRSGKRDAYLRGEATLRDAKEALRPKAIERGIAKALKPKKGDRRRKLDAFVANIVRNKDERIVSRIVGQLRDHDKSYNVNTIYDGVKMIPDDEYDKADKITYGQLRLYGRDREHIIVIDGKEFNPYWYH